MRERNVEQHLVARVKALGGEVRKVKWIGRRGAPDRLVLLSPEAGHRIAVLNNAFGREPRNYSRQHIMVELKRPGLDAEDYQAREHERLRAAGFAVLVLDTIEKIDEVFG